VTVTATIEAMPDPATRAAEFVERKGAGHPDTLCDAMAEAVSRALSQIYLARFGRILHHNVDKVLLAAGSAAPRFGGGHVTAPIRIVLAGRATAHAGGEAIDVEGIAVEAARACLAARLRHLDVARDVRFDVRIRPGSAELRALFARAPSVPLANDSSAGAGFAPLSPLEDLVLRCERMLTAPGTRPHPACGEDVKVAGIRHREDAALVVACPAIDALMPDADAYDGYRLRVLDALRRTADATPGAVIGRIDLNAADDPATGEVYLTVSGSSAEAGDDGEAGRGNRACGLIAPGRPMTMEATAGKNPCSHTGKLYALLAQEFAEEAVREIPGVAAAECLIASRIGAPIDQPALFHLRVATAPGATLPALAPALRERARGACARLPGLWRRIVAGEARLF
jgi:S-adenosylmethionine synthetase